VFSIYLSAFRSFSLHLSYSCYNSFLPALPVLFVTATGFLPRILTIDLHFCAPFTVYPTVMSNTAINMLAEPATAAVRTNSNATTRLNDYRDTLVGIVCGKSPHKSSDTIDLFADFTGYFFHFFYIFRTIKYILLSPKCM